MYISLHESHNNGIAANDNRNILVTFHIKIIVLSFYKENSGYTLNFK